MRKIYSFFIALLACVGFNLSLSAQATEGLPAVSSGVYSEYWYYIGNGHSSDYTNADDPSLNKPVNDSDGRFCSLITAPEIPGEATYQSYAGDVSARELQKWKLLESPDPEYNYLVNKKGMYLTYTSTRLTVTTVAPTEETQDSYMFQFALTQEGENGKESSWVTIKTKTANYVGGLNQGSNFVMETNNTTLPPALLDNGLNGSPRAWLFTQAEKIEDFYPLFSSSDATKETVVEWFRIKSLDPAVSENYLTLDPESKSFSLASKENSDNQLFGLVNKGYVTADKSNKIQIISKATGEFLDLTLQPEEGEEGEANILTTTEAGKEWVLKHVFSTKNNENSYQAVIRGHRYSNQPIITNKVDQVQPAWAKSYETFDNEYTWEFERESYEVNLIAGVGVQIFPNEAKISARIGQVLTFYYSVVGGAPVVTVNGELVLPGNLTEDGDYIFNLVVTGNMTLSVLSENATNKVTVNAESPVTVISPTLDNNNQYMAPTSSTISFKLGEGYVDPVVNATKATVGTISYSSEHDLYSVILTNIEDGASVNINAVLKKLPVTLIKSEGIYWLNNPASTVTYGENYTLSFRVGEYYHTPKVAIDGVFYEATKNGDNYTVTVPQVKKEITIAVGAFYQNIIPVTADTGVRGGADNENVSLINDSYLYAQYSTYASPSYMRRSYLEFDPSALISEFPNYEEVLLRLTVESIQDGAGVDLQLRSVPELDDIRLEDMTWVVNNEPATDTDEENEMKGTPIGETLTLTKEEYSNKSILDIDITDYLSFNESSEPFRLLLTGVSTSPSDKWVRFYSDNGAAAAGDWSLMPVLVFSGGKVGTPGVDVESDIKVYPSANQSLVIETKTSCEASIYTVSGQLVNSKNINGKETITLSKGMYIVKIDNKVWKVII